MYATYNEYGTGTTLIKPAFMLAMTAASTFAGVMIDVNTGLNNNELQIVTQNEVKDLNPYYNVNNNTSFYDEITNGSYTEIDSLIKNSMTQLQQLSFLTVDEEVDREIDSYFAKKRMSKVKTVIYKK